MLLSMVKIYSDEDIAEFVDSYVSCRADSDYLTDLVNLQRQMKP